MYCNNCGTEIKEDGIYCSKCGTSAYENKDPNVSEKNWLATFLLCFFLGTLGIHSFYAGKTSIGVIQLLTAGGCGIWTLIDLIMIICQTYKDEQGKYIKMP